MTTHWHPIDTAPNAVFVVSDGTYVCVASPVKRVWYTGWQVTDGFGTEVSLDPQIKLSPQPTHWMELPRFFEAGDK